MFALLIPKKKRNICQNMMLVQSLTLLLFFIKIYQLDMLIFHQLQSQSYKIILGE